MKRILSVLTIIICISLGSVHAQESNDRILEKAKSEADNGQYQSACELLKQITVTSADDYPVVLQSRVLLAEVYGNMGDVENMDATIADLELYLRAHPDSSGLQTSVANLHRLRQQVDRNNLSFADNLYGIWVSDYTYDGSKMPFFALDVFPGDTTGYKVYILPHCTLAKTYGIYSGASGSYVPQRQLSATTDIVVQGDKRKAAFYYGDQQFKKGSVFLAQLGFGMVAGVGFAVSDHLAYTAENPFSAGAIAGQVGVAIGVSILSELIAGATMPKITNTTFDVLLEEVFPGCCDVTLIRTTYTSTRSGGWSSKRESTRFMMYKLYPQYNVAFAAEGGEMVGNTVFNGKEGLDSAQYELAQTDRFTFNSQAYEKLAKEAVASYQSTGAIDDSRLSLIQDNFKYSTQGLWYNKETDSDGIYEGRLNKNGQRYGLGRYEWNNGDEYVGEWQDGQRTGAGYFKSADGSTYNGEWTNGKRNGEGHSKWATGDEYTGHWDNGKMTGFGSYTWSNGNKYTGSFKKGVRTGSGSLERSDSSIYTGEFKDNCAWGIGTLQTAEFTYEGKFKTDLMHGKGKVIYTNGDTFTGRFKQGKKNGKGVWTKANGEVLTGVWKDDQLVKTK